VNKYPKSTVCVSIVSHLHGGMVVQVVHQLLQFPEVGQIIVTLNLFEDLDLPEDQRIVIIHNKKPLGFSSNHNNAFAQTRAQHFCVLNPDITFIENPFPFFIDAIETRNAGVVCPQVLAPSGELEDNVREFPNLFDIILRGFGFQRKSPLQMDGLFKVPWCAGMCMCFSENAYKTVGGFDPGFFLYYEDVDICARMWSKGLSVYCSTKCKVIHEAQRHSHHKVSFLRLYLLSAIKYLLRYRLGLNVPKSSSE